MDSANQRRWKGLVLIARSLDGYIARADGDITWLTDPPPSSGHVPAQAGEHPPPDYDRFMATVDHLVMGRGTYEKVLTFDSWPYPAKNVLVVSTSLADDADHNITVVRSLDQVATVLADADARNVYVDGGRTIQAFLAYDLIDELVIATAPVMLGGGLPLFGVLSSDIRLTHLGTSSSDDGMVTSRYAVRRDPPTMVGTNAQVRTWL